MSPSMSKAQLDLRMHQILLEQDAVRQAIETLRWQIQEIEQGNGLNYWVWLQDQKRESSHKEVLMMKLQALRMHLRALRRESKRVGLALLRANVEKTSKENRRFMQQLLKKAEPRGELTEQEEKQLIQTAERTLRATVGLLGKDPSLSNIDTVLHALEDFQQVGGQGPGK